MPYQSPSAQPPQLSQEPFQFPYSSILKCRESVPYACKLIVLCAGRNNCTWRKTGTAHRYVRSSIFHNIYHFPHIFQPRTGLHRDNFLQVTCEQEIMVEWVTDPKIYYEACDLCIILLLIIIKQYKCMLLEHAEESSVWRRRDRHIQAILDTHSTWGHPDRHVHPIYYRIG